MIFDSRYIMVTLWENMSYAISKQFLVIYCKDKIE